MFNYSNFFYEFTLKDFSTLLSLANRFLFGFVKRNYTSQTTCVLLAGKRLYEHKEPHNCKSDSSACLVTPWSLGLTDSPTCERCLEKEESATHILCDCEAIAYLRSRHLGHYFMEPGDYHDAPINQILHFVRSVGLLEGWNRGRCTIDLGKVAVHGPIWASPCSFIQPHGAEPFLRSRQLRSQSRISNIL
jgi:hypothetical protein